MSNAATPRLLQADVLIGHLTGTLRALSTPEATKGERRESVEIAVSLHGEALRVASLAR